MKKHLNDKGMYKPVIILMVAWMAIEAAAKLLFFRGLPSVNGVGLTSVQKINIILHWPGLIISQSLNLEGKSYFVVTESITFFQMAILFWILTAIYRRSFTTSINT